ncbi:MAG TPA: glycosyltransferase family 4 protein [Terriglobales bacterium]|nr:glycosyltransferase family 4 protein [Terriglobales bacterium]
MAFSAIRNITEDQVPELAGTLKEPARRVLFVDHTAAISGGEIALVNLVHHLDSRKVKAIVVLGSDGPLLDRLGSTVEAHILPLSSSIATQKKDSLGFRSLLRIKDILMLGKYILLLARFIREHDIEIVHTNSLKADIIGGIAGRMTMRRVVWHVRDRIEDDYLPGSVVRVFRFLSHIIPHYVIANSAATLRTLHLPATALATSIPSGVELSGKVVIVHDGTAAVEPSSTLRNESVVRIGLIGRISPWKGQHIFIQAAELVRKRFPQARFVIIGAALFGEKQYEEEVRQLPRQLGIEQVVEFAGFCKDINLALRNLDLVVHASTKGEPFGQVIIEGMAAGKPVVATNGGGVPEIVEDGKTGLLVPMGDAPAMAEAICQILEAPERAREMGRQGCKRVAERFTMDQTARRVEAVYEEMSRR